MNSCIDNTILKILSAFSTALVYKFVLRKLLEYENNHLHSLQALANLNIMKYRHRMEEKLEDCYINNMADSFVTPEESNHLRAIYLSYSVAPKAVRTYFDKVHPPALLTQHLRHDFNNLSQIKGRAIQNYQWGQLYPSPGSPVATSSDYDITLLICLLRNMTPPEPPPPFGFDSLPDKSHTTGGAHLARIKFYRNRLAHSSEGKMSDSVFESLWNDLNEAIIGLGGPGFKKEMNDAKTIGLDSSCIEMIRKLISLENNYEYLSINIDTNTSDINRLENRIGQIYTIKQETEKCIEDLTLKINQLQVALEQNKEVRKKEDEKMIKVLSDRIRELERESDETIQRHKREKNGIILRSWWKDKTFVTTHAAENVCKFIRENNCVTVTGNSGVGKTTAVRHAAMVLLQEGYDVVPASTPEDILNFYNPKKKTLFVYDDLCGKYTLNQQYLNDWKLRLNAIRAFLENSQCKIMATCRLQVFKDERFKDLSIFSTCECNLSSKELTLSSDEKSGLIYVYCGLYASDVSDNFNCDFFPLLCNLFKATNSTNITQFFNNPFQFYDQEIKQLLKEDDTGKYKYCCLVLVVIFNNRLKEEFFSGKIDSKDQKILKAVLPECELNKGTSPKSLLKSLKTLEGTFLLNEDGFYKTIHDKLFDYLSHYFGNKMIHILIDHADSQFIRERFIWKISDQHAVTDLTSGETIYTDLTSGQITDTDVTSGQTTDTDFPSGQVTDTDLTSGQTKDTYLLSGQTTDTDFTINLHDKYLDAYLDRIIKDWSDGKVYSVFFNRNMKSKEFTAKLHDRLNQLNESKQSQLSHMTVNNGYDDTTLIQSCFKGDVNLTRWIINHGVSVNHCRCDGASALHIACQNGHIDTVRELIKCGSDFQKCMNNGVSPLYIACQNGHIDTVRELIKCGSDLQMCKNNGASPLYIACYNGHIDTVRELLKSGSDLQKCDNEGRSPLYIACYNGHTDTVRELIKSGSDLQKCHNTGVSPLYIACQNGHIDTVRELIKWTVDINKCLHVGGSPLFIAVVTNNKEIVEVLLDNDSDVNKCAENKEKYCEAIVKYCKNTADSHMDWCRDNFIFKYALPQVKQYVQETLGNNVMDLVVGSSPLHMACFMGLVDIVKLILEKNPNINITKEDGTTPLFLACRFGHTDIVKLMIEKGADDKVCRNDGISPFDIALENGHRDVISLLTGKKKKVCKG